MKTSNVQDQVNAFVAACRAAGFNWVCEPNVVRVYKDFTPGDKVAFTECDMTAASLLALAPLRGGSTWGTDGGSVGGYSALIHGRYELKKTGDGTRFKALLNKVAK